MDIIISNASGKPIYEQITVQIKSQILSGALTAGDALPSMRTLAKELRISVITTKRAYEDLERDGFIETVAGKGSFVASKNAEFLREEALRRVEAALQQAVDTASRSGVSPQALRQMLDRCLAGNSNMISAIEVRGLCKHYRDFSLRDVSFTVPGGSIMGFIGENGAGKTTTIKSILGLLHTDGGSISVLGRDPVTDRRAIGQDIGVVLDGSFFYEGMRAKDISAVMSRLHSRWDKESFASYCERFALPMEKPFKEFSKGMRAKLALTTALAHHPKLLVLDEATSGLDPVVRSEMLDLFLEFIQDEEHSILLSSHITSDLEKVADYITFIHAGKIVFSKTKDDILEQYGVVKCEKARAAALDGAHILGRRDSKFDAELLVDNRPEVARLYPGILTEQATIDDIMTFFAKGAYDA